MSADLDTMIASTNSLINALDSVKTHNETEKQLQMSDEQFKANLAWQREQQLSNQEFLNQQYQNQLDFANRQLDDQTTIANNNFKLAQDTQAFNQGMQNKQFEYQKQLNETQMEREDNAIQRQVADFQKAGFSPLAAIGGNGASAGSLSSASTSPISPAQYDSSGISAAAGQYADFARQYASLSFNARQDYINKRTEIAQRHNADITASRMALAQMRADMRYKNASASTQLFNALVNQRNSRLQNEYLSEQLSNLKDEHSWNKEHGYRGETPIQSIVAAIREYVNSKKDVGDTALETAGKVTKEVANTVRKNIDKIPEDMQIKIAESDLEDWQKIALSAYTEYIFHPVKSLKEAFSSVFEDGKELYNKYLRRGK